MDGPLRPLDKLSMANMQEYAKLVGADYELVTGRPFRRNLTGACQKVHMIEEKYDAYDQVLMVDIDMFAPIGMTENIFDLQGVGLYADTQVMLHRKILGHAPMFSSANHAYWGGAIYKMPKPLRMKLRRHLGGDESCSFLPEVEKAGFIHVRTKITPQGPKREKIDNYNALVAEGIL